MISPVTRSQDDIEKKKLYESIGVTEYWQFDPHGEWIPEKLRGFRLQGEDEPVYVPIADGQSQPLQLRLSVEDKIIAFHCLDSGKKLLPLAELHQALEQEALRADREAQRVQELEAQIAIYQQRLGEKS
jgi:hypothetical protein